MVSVVVFFSGSSRISQDDHCQFGNGVMSNMLYGVPQGSVLGPLLLVLYTTEVIAVVKLLGFSVHRYADDLQHYDHVAPSESMSVVSRLSDCVEAVKTWMVSSRLDSSKRDSSKSSKTELVWLGAPGTFSSVRRARCI